MDTIKNILKPGGKEDDDIMYGAGTSDPNRGKLSGEGSHFPKQSPTESSVGAQNVDQQAQSAGAHTSTPVRDAEHIHPTAGVTGSSATKTAEPAAVQHIEPTSGVTGASATKTTEPGAAQPREFPVSSSVEPGSSTAEWPLKDTSKKEADIREQQKDVISTTAGGSEPARASQIQGDLEGPVHKSKILNELDPRVKEHPGSATTGGHHVVPKVGETHHDDHTARNVALGAGAGAAGGAAVREGEKFYDAPQASTTSGAGAPAESIPTTTGGAGATYRTLDPKADSSYVQPASSGVPTQAPGFAAATVPTGGQRSTVPSSQSPAVAHGSMADPLTSQSATHQAAEPKEGDHHYARDAAIAGGAAGAGALGAHELSKDQAEKEAKAQQEHEKELQKQEKQQEKDAKQAQKEHEQEVNKIEKQHEKEEHKAQKEAEKEQKQHEKQVEKEHAAAVKQQEKEQKEAEKQAEKDHAAAVKQQEKEQKEAEKEAQKAEKQAEKEQKEKEKKAEKEHAAQVKQQEKEQKEAEKQAKKEQKEAEKEEKPSLISRLLHRNKDGKEEEDKEDEDGKGKHKAEAAAAGAAAGAGGAAVAAHEHGKHETASTGATPSAATDSAVAPSSAAHSSAVPASVTQDTTSTGNTVAPGAGAAGAGAAGAGNIPQEAHRETTSADTPTNAAAAASATPSTAHQEVPVAAAAGTAAGAGGAAAVQHETRLETTGTDGLPIMGDAPARKTSVRNKLRKDPPPGYAAPPPKGYASQVTGGTGTTALAQGDEYVPPPSTTGADAETSPAGGIVPGTRYGSGHDERTTVPTSTAGGTVASEVAYKAAPQSGYASQVTGGTGTTALAEGQNEPITSPKEVSTAEKIKEALHLK